MEGEGIGDARRAIEACLTEASVAGDLDRIAEVEIGDDERGRKDEEPSPLSNAFGDDILADELEVSLCKDQTNPGTIPKTIRLFEFSEVNQD